MEFHRSASRHGIAVDEVIHAIDHSMVVVDMDPEADPPKLLVMVLEAMANSSK